MGYVYDGGASAVSARGRTYTAEKINYDDTSLLNYDDEDDIIENREELMHDPLSNEDDAEIDSLKEPDGKKSILEGYSYAIKDMGTVASVDWNKDAKVIRVSDKELSGKETKLRSKVEKFEDLLGDNENIDSTIFENILINPSEDPEAIYSMTSDSVAVPRLGEMYRIDNKVELQKTIDNFDNINNDVDRKAAIENIFNILQTRFPDMKVKRTNSISEYLPDNNVMKPMFESVGSIIKHSKATDVRSNDVDYMPIYVVLTASESTFAKSIRAYTGAEFSHASISFNHNMKRLYSFNVDGFVTESFDKNEKSDEITKLNPNTIYGIYTCFVKKEKVIQMANMIENLAANRDKTKYNVAGILKYILKVPSKKVNEFEQYCSQFVANMLKIVNDEVLSTPSDLTAPAELVSKNTKFYYLGTGPVSNYKADVVLKKLTKLIENVRFRRYLIENSLFYNNLFYNPDFAPYVQSLSEWSIFDSFFPSCKYGLINQIVSSCGGLYGLSPNISSDDIYVEYDANKNFYKAATICDVIAVDEINTYDVAHIKYCLNLYDIVMNILNGATGLLQFENLTDNQKKVILDWLPRINIYLKKYNSAYGDEKLKYRQYLHDLLWDTSEVTDEIINANIYAFFRELNIVQNINESYDFINKEDLYAYMAAKNLNDDIFFLLPAENRYPIFDKISVRMAADIAYSIEPEDRETFIKNLQDAYQRYKCEFSIAVNHPSASCFVKDSIIPIDVAIRSDVPEINPLYIKKEENDDKRFSFESPLIDAEDILKKLELSVDRMRGD